MLMVSGETLVDIPLSGILQEEGVPVDQTPCSTVSTVY